jgi:NitT/TauT family transport system substrate-binding protein
LKIFEGNGSVTTVQIIGTGDSTFGLVSLTNLAEAIPKGIPVRSIYVLTHDSGYAILSLNEMGIKNPKDLIGKSVGVSPSGTSRAVLPAFLIANGMDIKQVKEVAFEGSGRFNAVLMKKVDAAVGPYPSEVPVFESKGAKISVLKLSDWGISILGFGIIVNEKLITESPDLIKRFLQATTRSLFSTIGNPDEAIKAMAKGYIKPEPRVWAYDWNLHVETMDSKYAKGKPMGWQPKEEWEQTKDFLSRYVNKAVGEVPLTSFYTNDFISR